MHHKKLLAVCLGVITSAAAKASNSVVSSSDCDVNCVHRLLFHAGYASAVTGFKMVFGACEASEWCYSNEKEWCPETVSSIVTKIASQAKLDSMTGTDYNNMTNIALLSATSTISARSARMGISLAQSLLKSRAWSCVEGVVADLERIRWLMDEEQDPIDFDADKFDKYISIPGYEALEGRATLEGCKSDPVLCANAPFFRRLFKGARKLIPSRMLRFLTKDAKPVPLSVGEDEEGQFSFDRWWKMEGSKIAEKWLDDVPDVHYPVPQDVLPQPGEPDYPFFPPNPDDPSIADTNDDDIPPARPPQREPWPPSDLPSELLPVGEAPAVAPESFNIPGPEGLELFRAETFHPISGVAKQITVTPSKVTGTRTHPAGLKAYDVLDSAGNHVQTILRDPSTLSRMPGQWVASGGEQFVRQQMNDVAGRMEPVLNSLGEPLVASAQGGLNTLAVAEGGVESIAGEAAGGIADIAAITFSIFLPEGGQPSNPLLTYDTNSGSVEVHSRDDPLKDAQDLEHEPFNSSEGLRSDEPIDHDDADTAMPDPATPDTNLPTTALPTAGSMPTIDGKHTQTGQVGRSMPVSHTTPEGPQIHSAASIKSVKSETSTKFVTYVLSTTVPVTQTAFNTTTMSKPHKTETSSSSPSDITTITGCRSLRDCPICGRDSSCQIGDLPPECVIGAMEIDEMPFWTNVTWEFCVDKILKSDRLQAKAWAKAIFTQPTCVSNKEWWPNDFSQGQHNECWYYVRGDDFRKVSMTYITGLLPLACPPFGPVEHASWAGYSETIRCDCVAVAETLSKPFKEDLSWWREFGEFLDKWVLGVPEYRC